MNQQPEIPADRSIEEPYSFSKDKIGKELGYPLKRSLLAGLGFFVAPYFTTPRPDQHGDPNRHAPHTINRWFDTSVFAAPPADGIKPGSARPWSVRGPGVVRLDAAVTKNTRIGEHIALQFRAEATNALNHTNFDGVNGWFLDQNNFGKVGSARDPRIVQLGLKLTF
jgi:hypothetical protein